MSLSSPIIKVNKLIGKGKDKIESIIVFWGTNLEIPNPTTLFNEFINCFLYHKCQNDYEYL